MRAQQATSATTKILGELLADDVAQAITGDTDPFEGAARFLGHQCASEDDLRRALEQIAAQIDDGLADWLVDHAESPGAWFYKQAQNAL